eukprot:PhM_4_TR4313/c0_g1_i1/m.16241
MNLENDSYVPRAPPRGKLVTASHNGLSMHYPQRPLAISIPARVSRPTWKGVCAVEKSSHHPAAPSPCAVEDEEDAYDDHVTEDCVNPRILCTIQQDTPTPHRTRALPRDAVAEALSFLTFREVVRLGAVSRTWLAMSNSETVWVCLCQREGLVVKRDMPSKEVYKAHIRSYQRALDDELEDLQRRYKSQSARLRQSSYFEDEVNEVRERVQVTVAPSMFESVQNIEGRVEALKADIGSIEYVQRSLQTARREHDSRLLRLQNNVEAVEGTTHIATVAARRRDFVRGFERKVCRAILQDAPGMSVVLRRGTETLVDLDRVVSSLQGPQWESVRRRWMCFQRVFPLADDYWDMRLDLIEGTASSVGSQRRVHPSAEAGGSMMQVLGFGRSPRSDTLLRLMWDMSQMTVQDLGVYVIR